MTQDQVVSVPAVEPPIVAGPPAVAEPPVVVGSRPSPARISHNRRMLYATPLAGMAGSAVMVVLSAAIYLGSGKLRDFDPALIGYATATVFLAFGTTYRFVLWVSNPPARRYFLRGWRAVLRPGTLTRTPGLVPRTIGSSVLFQSFIRQRGLARWLAHQSMFWGVILAASVTFPLTFGWIHFRAAAGGQGYAMYMLGVKALSFNAFNWLGWLMFHALDIAAVLVIAGSGYYLVHRLEDRQVMAHQRTIRDLLPLVALLAISFTGLSLTVSTAVFHGRSYHVLALVHMAVVVLTLLYIPFGKFFHIIHRTASVGVPVYQATSLQAQGGFACRVCGEPLEATAFVRDLELTMEELDLRYPRWVETCPRCKRVERGIAYRTHLKAGFQ